MKYTMCLIFGMLALGLVAVRRPDAPPAKRLAAPLRSGCGFKAPYRVVLKALSTPVVGKELELELSVANGPVAGLCRSWIQCAPGLIEGGPLEWTQTLGVHQSATYRTRVKALSSRPIELTGKMCQVTQDLWARLPGESYLTLYPFELDGHALRVNWTPPKPTLISFSDGDTGLVIRMP